MTIYYDPLVFFPRVLWSKTIYPRVFLSFEFWLCAIAHVLLTVFLRLGYLPHLSADGDPRPLVPLELVAPLVGLCGLTTAQLLRDCRTWNEAFTAACARVGEQTRRFTQELQATFGLVDEVLPVRFAAGKYSLAAVYVFFFSLTGGAVTARGWSELRAKGLLDDREVHFMAKQYGGDRLALLHVWAMWAVQEAAASPASRGRMSPEAIAGGLMRLSDALRGASNAAREAASRAALPVPYHQFQLHDSLMVVSMLFLGAVAAPRAAVGEYMASACYLVVLLAAIALREAAASLSDPFRRGRLGHSFPVAATVNATADAVAQMLICSSPAAFDPCPAWWDPSSALLSQNQIERRTPAAAFGIDGANPCHWPATQAPVAGDQAPPPLLDSGCCHLDLDALPQVSAVKRRGNPLQVTRRPRQAGLGSLLARVQLAAESKGKACGVGGKGCHLPSPSTEEPSEASCESAPPATTFGSGTADNTSEVNDWDVLAEKVAALPREHSLASSFASFCYPGAIGASKAHRGPRSGSDLRPSVGDGVIVAGTWAEPADQPPRRGGTSVSPEDLVLSTA